MHISLILFQAFLLTASDLVDLSPPHSAIPFWDPSILSLNLAVSRVPPSPIIPSIRISGELRNIFVRLSPKAIGTILAIVQSTLSEDEENVLVTPTSTSRLIGEKEILGRSMTKAEREGHEKEASAFAFFPNKEIVTKYMNQHRYYHSQKVSIWKQDVKLRLPEITFIFSMDAESAPAANRIVSECHESNSDVTSELRESQIPFVPFQSGDVFMTLRIRQVCSHSSPVFFQIFYQSDKMSADVQNYLLGMNAELKVGEMVANDWISGGRGKNLVFLSSTTTVRHIDIFILLILNLCIDFEGKEKYSIVLF